MTEIITDFQQTILIPAFQAERNLYTWRIIAGESSFLQTQSKEVIKMYCFIQEAASTNFILQTANLFDQPSKQYPTRCILGFLNKMNDGQTSFDQIVETSSTIQILKKYQVDTTLIDAVTNKSAAVFPMEFCKYFLKKYQSPDIKAKVKALKTIREKAIAHNEALQIAASIEVQVISELLAFVLEMIAIFDMAYTGTIWLGQRTNFIEKNVERDAYFIKDQIQKLKDEKKK